jgi:hypothetical protein
MAFKLTYSDGHETDYDDETKWEVENGVVKLGSEEGKWSVYISPSHWATLELTAGKDKSEKEDKGKDKKDKDEDKDDKDEDKDKDEDEDEDDKDDKDEDKDEDKDD